LDQNEELPKTGACKTDKTEEKLRYGYAQQKGEREI